MLVGGGVVVLVVEGGGRVYTRDFGKSSLVGIEGVVAISFFIFILFVYFFCPGELMVGSIGGKSGNGGVVVVGGRLCGGGGLGACYGLAEVGLGSEPGKMSFIFGVKI